MGTWTPGPGATGGDDTFTGDGTGEIADGLAGADTLNGNGGADTLTGGLGDDEVFGGAGDDVIIINAGDDEFGETYSGGADSDTIRLVANHPTIQSYDLYNDTLSSIERIEFTALPGAGGVNWAFLAPEQMGGGIVSATAQIVGSDLSDLLGFSMFGMVGYNLNLSGFTFSNWSATDSINIQGADGNDVFVGSSVIDQMTGFAGADTMTGGAGNDTLSGGTDNDTLYGRNGDDRIDGGAGADTLYGGNDSDTFVFSSTLGSGVDLVGDFNVAQDTIELDDDIFGLGASGAIDADAFHIGAVAADAEDRIIYDPATGALYYDADGNGGGGAIQFATLAAGLALTNADFVGGP